MDISKTRRRIYAPTTASSDRYRILGRFLLLHRSTQAPIITSPGSTPALTKSTQSTVAPRLEKRKEKSDEWISARRAAGYATPQLLPAMVTAHAQDSGPWQQSLKRDRQRARVDKRKGNSQMTSHLFLDLPPLCLSRACRTTKRHASRWTAERGGHI